MPRKPVTRSWWPAARTPGRATETSILATEHRADVGRRREPDDHRLSGSRPGYRAARQVDHTAVVDGFTITHGSASLGAGISVQSHNSPTIKNCVIVENSAGAAGGGVFVSEHSSPTFIDCTIEKNQALLGGGIGVGEDFQYDVEAELQPSLVYGHNDGVSTFTNCTISGNQAFQGGGLFVYYNGSPIIDHSTISGNLATFGGGLMIVFSSDIDITSCTIAANHALAKGGGMYVAASVQPPVTQTTVWSNCADAPMATRSTSRTSGPSVSFACSDVDDSGVDGQWNRDVTTGTRFMPTRFSAVSLPARALRPRAATTPSTMILRPWPHIVRASS